MLDYGTQIVAGVTPGKGGVVKVFLFIIQLKKQNETGANVSVVYVPAPCRFNFRSSKAELDMVICITEHIPVVDMVKVKRYYKDVRLAFSRTNCPGVITADECKIGIMPGYIHKKVT